MENKEIAENHHPNRSKLRSITRFSETRFLIPNWADASIGVLNPIRNKIIIITITIIFLSFIAYNFWPNNPQVCINSHCYNVELAISDEEKSQGLMFRKYLKENSGMLFLYDSQDIYTFWMKNTLIPLDLIWINKDSEIVYIEHSATPCKNDSCPTYSSNIDSSSILEINAGQSIKNNFKIGDMVTYQNIYK